VKMRSSGEGLRICHQEFEFWGWPPDPLRGALRLSAHAGSPCPEPEGCRGHGEIEGNQGECSSVLHFRISDLA